MRIFPEVVVFEHRTWGGAEWRTNLNHSYIGDWWNDKISSVMVISGTWEFFQHRDFQGAMTRVGPGYYEFVESAPCNMTNDTISSFRVVSWNPQGD